MIKEYTVLIDSKDRNYQVYPDPFHYTVTFNPLPATRELVNGEYVYHETPTPVINKDLRQIKYVKLEHVIMPKYRLIWNVRNEDGYCQEQVFVHKPITDNLYTVLSFGRDFIDENYASTNDVLADSFATIYYDSDANATHYNAKISNGVKIFPPNRLGSLNKIHVDFMDPYGEQITCPHVDKNILSPMICTCHDPEGDVGNTDCFKHNLRHPLNPIFQHHIQLKVGVVESYIA